MSQQTTKPRTKRSRAYAAGVLSLLAAGVVWVLWKRVPPKVPPPTLDPLCTYVQQQKLECPALLASTSVLRPGSITHLSSPASPPSGVRVEIPSSQLDTACLLPGTTLALPPASDTPFTLPTFSYEGQTAIAVGARLPLPQLRGVEIKAGPNYSQTTKVVIAADQGTLQLLDENRLAQLIGDCRIRPSCVRRIREEGDRVVNAVLIADGLGYEFVGKDGRAMPIQAAISGNVVADVGPLSSSSATETRLRAQHPVVLGVTFVRSSALASASPCNEPAVFSADGSSVVTLTGGGGVGNVGPEQTRSARLGESAALSVRGSETSECNAGFERNTSAAAASGTVRPGSSGAELSFEGSASASGGHYVTVAGCFGGQPIGITGHDTGSSASATFQGRISALVRREAASTLRVTWEGVAPAVRLTVFGPLGQRLSDDRTLEGSGTNDIPVSDGGLYAFAFDGRLSASANGAAGSQSATLRGSVKVALLD